MSDNEHAAAIIERCKAGDIWGADLFTVADHAKALAAELAEVRELASTYSAALSMVEDRLAEFAGDDTSINDIRQSLGLPARDDMLPAPGGTDNQEARPMDTLNDHAARISARIEEYRTLDLIGRNSADDLQHHLRALVAERDEARRDRDAREEAFDMCARSVLPYQEYIEELESKRAEANARADAAEAKFTRLVDRLKERGMIDPGLDAAPGDTAGS